MNRFIKAVTAYDVPKTQELLAAEPKWRTWSQPDGKNALHFACGTPIVKNWNVTARELERPDPEAVERSIVIAKLLMKYGLDINSLHHISDKNCTFPATPVWYAYTRGRNERLYRWLLDNGGRPDNCMFAIAWNDDARAAELFTKHGAQITGDDGRHTPLLAAVSWKRFEIAEWFLKNGADPNVTDERGRTPLQIAIKKKYSEQVIKMLIKYGCAAG